MREREELMSYEGIDSDNNSISLQNLLNFLFLLSDQISLSEEWCREELYVLCV